MASFHDDSNMFYWHPEGFNQKCRQIVMNAAIDIYPVDMSDHGSWENVFSIRKAAISAGIVAISECESQVFRRANELSQYYIGGEL